jgi:hypothetical protein
VLVIPMPGGMAAPTDTFPAMIAWMYRHGGPRTGEVLTRLERHGWQLELLDPGAGTHAELWASARFADVTEARAAAQAFRGGSASRCSGHRPSAGRGDDAVGGRAARRAADVSRLDAPADQGCADFLQWALPRLGLQAAPAAGASAKPWVGAGGGFRHV